jgi:hypothetical protein
MEKMNLWWQKRSVRDRRAIVVLAVVVPVILFWYFVTVPLQERLKMAHRVLETRRSEASEVQKLLQEYSLLRAQLQGVEFRSSPVIVPQLEQTFNGISASESVPVLNRANVQIFGKAQPGASIRIEKAQPRQFWNLLRLIASSGVYIAEFDISATPQKNELSAALKAWLPDKN